MPSLAQAIVCCCCSAHYSGLGPERATFCFPLAVRCGFIAVGGHRRAGSQAAPTAVCACQPLCLKGRPAAPSGPYYSAYKALDSRALSAGPHSAAWQCGELAGPTRPKGQTKHTKSPNPWTALFLQQSYADLAHILTCMVNLWFSRMFAPNVNSFCHSFAAGPGWLGLLRSRV